MALKLIEAWKAGGLKELSIGHPGGEGSFGAGSQLYLPTRNFDTRAIGDGSGNSAVEACMRTLVAGFVEPPFAHSQQVDGQEELDTLHPMVQLVNEPNPYMTGSMLWASALVGTHVKGNAYWFKQRNGVGRVMELWPLIPSLITPRDATGTLATPEERAAHREGRGPFIAYYEYQPGSVPIRLETSDVIHFRMGQHPTDPRQGRGPLETVLREVMADEEAGQFATALLSNMGVPGVVLSPKDANDLGPSPDEAKEMQRVWSDRFGGRNRGKPYVARGGPLDVTVVSFTPDQMNFTQLRRLPEERISSVLGVPAILAGLGAGLDRATYSNAGELREYFTEQKLAPLWREYGQLLTSQLLSEWLPAVGERATFDLSEVRALQQDEDALWKRMTEAVRAGVITVAEFKAAVGLTYTDADEVYLRPVSLMEVPASMDAEANQLVADIEDELAEGATVDADER